MSLKEIVITSLMSVITLAPYAAVNAQSATGPAQPPAVETASQSAAPELQDIVVTGSRILKAGLQAPTPVTTETADTLQTMGPGPIAELLNQLPQFANSLNASNSSSTTSSAQRVGDYLNLRALGSQRVLVLEDGQRLAPSGDNGGVDASLIPDMLTCRHRHGRRVCRLRV